MLERPRKNRGSHVVMADPDPTKAGHQRRRPADLVQVAATPIYDPDGSYAGSVAMATNLTSRRAAEESLRVSEARYHALLDHMPDTFAVVYDRELRSVVVAGGGLRNIGATGPIWSAFGSTRSPRQPISPSSKGCADRPSKGSRPQLSLFRI